MSIIVQCAGCASRYSVSDEKAGATIRCTQCGAAIRVPGGGPGHGDMEPSSLASRFVAYAGMVNAIVIASLAALGVAALLAWSGSLAAAFAPAICVAVIAASLVLIVVGVLRSLFEPFSESIACGLLHLLVPFYALYYLVTRWERMGPWFLMYFKGVGLWVAAWFVMAMATHLSGSTLAGTTQWAQSV